MSPGKCPIPAAGKAFELAGTLKGSAGEEAANGAFFAASEFHHEVALAYLSTIADQSRQNSLLNIPTMGLA